MDLFVLIFFKANGPQSGFHSLLCSWNQCLLYLQNVFCFFREIFIANTVQDFIHKTISLLALECHVFGEIRAILALIAVLWQCGICDKSNII